MDQVAGIAAQVTAAVDRTGVDVADVRQAVTTEAEAVRALVNGAAEEQAQGLARLGEDQSARVAAVHESVSGGVDGLAVRVAEESAAVRADLRVRGDGLRDQVAKVAGDVSAVVDLMSEIPEQVRTDTNAAASAVERTGADLAARVEAAGAAMTGRTDHLCGLLRESGHAADSAVISLGRRVAAVEDRAGLTAEPVSA